MRWLTGELVGEDVSAARRLDGIHVADDVGDGDVRGGVSAAVEGAGGTVPTPRGMTGY
jgi:hypothetical protein